MSNGKNPIFCAVIVAGGRGTRFGSSKKLFAKIAGIPVFVRAILPFVKFCQNRIVLVVPDANREEFSAILRKFLPDSSVIFASSGQRRFDSVKSGLEVLKIFGPDFVAIHDAARPLISEKVIGEAFNFAQKNGSAVVSAKIADTVKIVDREKCEIRKTLNRDLLWTVQTPQIFKFKEIFQAYKKASNVKKEFTDDASVMEFCKKKVFIFPNQSPNIKITWKSDLLLARAIVKEMIKSD